jgi:hypothetical protein
VDEKRTAEAVAALRTVFQDWVLHREIEVAVDVSVREAAAGGWWPAPSDSRWESFQEVAVFPRRCSHFLSGWLLLGAQQKLLQEGRHW